MSYIENIETNNTLCATALKGLLKFNSKERVSCTNLFSMLYGNEEENKIERKKIEYEMRNDK